MSAASEESVKKRVPYTDPKDRPPLDPLPPHPVTGKPMTFEEYADWLTGQLVASINSEAKPK